MALIEICDLGKEYELGRHRITALEQVNLQVDEGEFAAVCGPSGSGKTTLLNIIGLLDGPTSGSYSLDGAAVTETDFNDLAERRNRSVGFIFQSFNLIPVLSVYENIELPLRINRHRERWTRGEIEELADAVGLGAYLRRRPDELSGGQRQRVAVARALVTRPKLLLADEPTANLDSETAGAILDLMLRLNRERRVTFLFSTHDQRILQKARRVIELRDGRVARDEVVRDRRCAQVSDRPSAR